MTCQDVREHLSALLVGHIGLTEQVPLEAHLRLCEACEEEIEDLRTRDRARPPIWRPNLDRIRNGPLRLAVFVTLVAFAAVGLARYRAELGAAIRPWVPSALLTSDPPAMTVPAAPVLYPSEVPSAPERLAEATAPAELPPSRRSPAPLPPVSERRVSRPAKPEARKPVPVEPPPQKDNASAAAAASTPHVAGDARLTPDVVGRLRVKSRRSAERDLAALLAKTGGATVTWQRGEKITVIDAVIPNPSYSKFADGLTRIGSWQIEAERSRLPDPVRFTMRLTE